MSVSVCVKNSVQLKADWPHWDEDAKSLLYIDGPNCSIHRWNSVTKEDDVITLDESVSFVIPSSTGGYVIGLGGKTAHLDWDTRKITVLFDACPEGATRVIFNDGKCDASGRLWAATKCLNVTSDKVPEKRTGSLYCMRRNGCTMEKIDNIEVTTGITWSNDNTVMYRSDPVRKKIYALDFDFVLGEIGNKRTALDFTNNKTAAMGHPGGMCSDADGKIWVAFSDVGKVIRYDPITGERLQEISIPSMQTTSCCFGGENLDELYITTANDGVSDKNLDSDSLSGSVFKVTGLGVVGVAPPVWQME